MFKIIRYNRQIDKNFKSLIAYLYCRLTGKEETKLIRFWGRAIDFTFVMACLDLATNEIGYSSVADFVSPLMYLLAGFVSGSFVLYAVDYYLSLNKKWCAAIILFLAIAVSLLTVGYAIYSMNEIARSAEVAAIESVRAHTEEKWRPV